LDQLPPRISDAKLFALLLDVLNVSSDTTATSGLRLRLLEKDFSWQSLADMALNQDVLFPLIWALRSRALLLPAPRKPVATGKAPAVSGSLEATYANHLGFRARQRHQLKDALATLNREQIAPLLLKGSRYLFEPEQSWAGARNMRDIDVLLPVTVAEAGWKALQRSGYVASGGHEPAGKHMPELFHPDWPSAVEIHTEALALRGREILPSGDLWSLAQNIGSADGEYWILPDEWHALHCAVNHQLTDQGFDQHVLALKPLWEFAQLARRFDLPQWDSIWERMSNTGHADMLGSFAALAEKLFGLALPGGLPITGRARRHAEATLAGCSRPELLRRSSYIIGQLRTAYSRQTLGHRYGLAPSEVSVTTSIKHTVYLLKRYRGHLAKRILGRKPQG